MMWCDVICIYNWMKLTAHTKSTKKNRVQKLSQLDGVVATASVWREPVAVIKFSFDWWLVVCFFFNSRPMFANNGRQQTTLNQSNQLCGGVICLLAWTALFSHLDNEDYSNSFSSCCRFSFSQRLTSNKLLSSKGKIIFNAFWARSQRFQFYSVFDRIAKSLLLLRKTFHFRLIW